MPSPAAAVASTDLSFSLLLLQISDDWEVIDVHKKGEKGSSYDDFLEELPEDECRYAIYDYEFEDDGRKQSKILFVVWAPDTATS